MTIPVATPMAKFTAKIFVQNFAAASYSGSFVRRYCPSRYTITTDNPMVRGGNR